MISVAHGHLMNHLNELNLDGKADLIGDEKQGIGTCKQFKEKISGYAFSFILGGTNIILDAIGWLVIVPVTVFYLLKDWDKIFTNCKQILHSN